MPYFFYTDALSTYIFDEGGKQLKKRDIKPSYESQKTISCGRYAAEELSLLEEFKGKDIISLVSKEDYRGMRKADFSDKQTNSVFSKIMRKSSTKEHFARLRSVCLEYSAEQLRRTEPQDHIIIQSVNAIEELERTMNTLSTRLREWFSLYNPELSRMRSDHLHYAEEVLKLPKDKESIGMHLKKEDLEPVKTLAEQIISMHGLKSHQERYLEGLMEKTYPNISAVATPLIAARLISYAGSMHRLMNFPSSTIQTLGAEKAMFRHLRSSSNPPKHGIIILHPLVNEAKKADKGKLARSLASKISIAARIDFFGSDGHTGYQLREELEKRYK